MNLFNNKNERVPNKIIKDLLVSSPSLPAHRPVGVVSSLLFFRKSPPAELAHRRPSLIAIEPPTPPLIAISLVLNTI